jgi:hypothetical protein
MKRGLYNLNGKGVGEFPIHPHCRYVHDRLRETDPLGKNQEKKKNAAYI